MSDQEVDTIGANFVPMARSDVAVEELDGELVMLDEITGAVHVLNATAAVVWRCLDGEVDVATLAAELADAFGVDVEQVRDDVVAMVRQLATDGLLVGFEPQPPASEAEVEPDEADSGSPRFLESPPNT